MKSQDYIFILVIFFSVIIHVSKPRQIVYDDTKDIIELNKAIEAPEEYKVAPAKDKKRFYEWDIEWKMRQTIDYLMELDKKEK